MNNGKAIIVYRRCYYDYDNPGFLILCRSIDYHRRKEGAK